MEMSYSLIRKMFRKPGKNSRRKSWGWRRNTIEEKESKWKCKTSNYIRKKLINWSRKTLGIKSTTRFECSKWNRNKSTKSFKIVSNSGYALSNFLKWGWISLSYLSFIKSKSLNLYSIPFVPSALKVWSRS